MSPIEFRGDFDAVLEDYYGQIRWIESLMLDPKGLRYQKELSPEERLIEYQRSIERTRSFLDFLGNPQDKYPTAHIAGTGGKGSVTIMIGKMLQTLGIKTGVHTSPYLQVPNEKWVIEDKMISPSSLSNSIKKLRSQFDQYALLSPEKLTNYSETQVCLTYQLFADQQINFGVVETGMGGRFDPTNVIDSDVAVITNVDLDHIPQLGYSLIDIARHKAGIIKPGRPVIVGTRQKDALGVITDEAASKSSPIFLLERDFGYRIENLDRNGSTISFYTPFGLFENIRVALPGRFQAENAAIAIMAIATLAEERNLHLNAEVLNQALSNLIFPGRMEKVQENPIVILDGAHNPQKMNALSQSMKDLYPNEKYCLVIGMLSTKDAEGIKSLLYQSSRIIVTSPNVKGKPSIAPEEIMRKIKNMNPSISIRVEKNVSAAISSVVAEETDDLILITGSVYLIGEARNYWHSATEILGKAEYTK